MKTLLFQVETYVCDAVPVFFSLCASTQIIAHSHIINPYGIINLNRRKNPLSLKTAAHENCHPFIISLVFRNTCFLGFSFILIEPRRGDDGVAGFVWVLAHRGKLANTSS